jgi:fimbrial chaperone protein
VRLAALGLLASGLLLAGRAQGAGLNVSPVQVHLTREAAKALITLRNDGAEANRFQISVSAWDEDPKAGMKLAPTEEVVFFPTLLELKPAETKNVRVGVAGFGPLEKTYRLFIEELPPAEKPQASRSTVRVLTRVGIPIFAEPHKAVEGHKLSALQLASGKAALEVQNTGNVHFRVDHVQLEGFAGGGAKVFAQQVQGWYVLAGGHKRYELEVPKDGCSRVRKLVATVKTDKDQAFQQSLETPAGACGT